MPANTAAQLFVLQSNVLKKKARPSLVDFWNRLLLSEQYKISKLCEKLQNYPHLTVGLNTEIQAIEENVQSRKEITAAEKSNFR